MLVTHKSIYVSGDDTCDISEARLVVDVFHTLYSVSLINERLGTP